MAEITKRIVLFLISLVLIILYLVSATTSYANNSESFQNISPKQMIKQEIANVPENSIIFNEAVKQNLRAHGKINRMHYSKTCGTIKH